MSGSPLEHNKGKTSEGKNLVLGVLHSNNAHTEYPVLTNSQWNVSENGSVEQQVCHY